MYDRMYACLRMCLGVLKSYTGCSDGGIGQHTPPSFRLRWGQLALTTNRRSEIGNFASAFLQLHHHLHQGRRRPLATRLHYLSEQLRVDLGNCDKLITNIIVPWETKYSVDVMAPILQGKSTAGRDSLAFRGNHSQSPGVPLSDILTVPSLMNVWVRVHCRMNVNLSRYRLLTHPHY